MKGPGQYSEGKPRVRSSGDPIRGVVAGSVALPSAPRNSRGSHDRVASTTRRRRGPRIRRRPDPIRTFGAWRFGGSSRNTLRFAWPGGSYPAATPWPSAAALFCALASEVWMASAIGAAIAKVAWNTPRTWKSGYARLRCDQSARRAHDDGAFRWRHETFSQVKLPRWPAWLFLDQAH